MVNSRRWPRHRRNKSIAPVTSKVIRDEHERRMHISLDVKSLPSSWEEFNKLSPNDQYEMAKILSMAVRLYDHQRSDFIQGVLMEYEWVLIDFWEYACEGCDLPYSFCNILSSGTL